MCRPRSPLTPALGFALRALSAALAAGALGLASVVLFVVLFTGCSKSDRDRRACYAAAELRAAARAHRECPGSWESCEARPVILAELETAYRGCR